MPGLVSSYKQGGAWKQAQVGQKFSQFLGSKGVIIVSWNVRARCFHDGGRSCSSRAARWRYHCECAAGTDDAAAGTTATAGTHTAGCPNAAPWC
jgi:hypothetical protein